MVSIGGLLASDHNAEPSEHVDALGLQVANVDRRLARLEGWIEGKRTDGSRPDPATGTQG